MLGRSILGGLLLAASAWAVQAPPQEPAGAPPRDAGVQAALADALEASPDRSDFQEDAAFRLLVAAVLELKPQDVAALAPGPLDPAQLLAEPEGRRGAWVKARGHVMMRREIVLPEPIGEVRTLERAILKLADGSHAVCDLIGDPPPYKKQADLVEVGGVFFRLVSYEANSGVRQTLPYVMVRSMELVDTPASGLFKSLLRGGPRLLAGVAIGLAGVLLFVFYLRHAARSDA